MFISKSFYHQHLRKITIAFGSMFSNLLINRTDEGNNIVQPLRVPLTFSPKEKFIARIEEAESFENGRAPFEITLPRMAFNMTRLQYTGERNLSQITPVRARDGDGNMQSSFFSAPYELSFELSVFTKTLEDNFQIVEQIVPYFKPDLSVTINELAPLGIKRDVQFIMNSVDFDINYGGAMMGDRRMVLTDLSFTARMHFFGHVGRSSEIRKVIQNVFAGDTPESAGTRITTEVTPDATPDNITFTQSIEDFFDNDI